jgi:hypothetical protein
MPADINAISPHAATDYIIPQMTAFFVDCFTADSKRRAYSSTSALIFPRIVRAPISAPDTTGIGGSPDVKSEAKAIGGRTAKGPENRVTIRTLVQFISHHFNNILMGIWGNVSLVRQALEPHHPTQGLIGQTENLIQDGAFFIHLILGYLAERRVSAKRLRLNQLVNKISLYVPDVAVQKELVRQLQVNAELRRPRSVAGSTARILDYLMHGIESLCREIDGGVTDHPKVKERIAKIDDLAIRGRRMTTLLHHYAGRMAPKRRCFNLQHLIERQCHRISNIHPNIIILQSWLFKKNLIVCRSRSIRMDAGRSARPGLSRHTQRGPAGR